MADSNSDGPRPTAEQAETGLTITENAAAGSASTVGELDNDTSRKRAGAPVEASDGTDASDGAVKMPSKKSRPEDPVVSEIRADISEAKSRLRKAEADIEEYKAEKKKYEAIAEDHTRAPEERAGAKRLLMATVDTIKSINESIADINEAVKTNTNRLAALENDLRAATAAQPAPQPSAPPVYDALEKLILAMGGKVEEGALQLNVLEPPSGSLSTQFRGRATELKQFAKIINAYLKDASSDRSEHHPFLAVTALPGTGKTTFGVESFAHLPGYLNADAAQLVRKGITVYLNLNGGGASWTVADNRLSAEARLVARIVATIFLSSGYEPIWKRFQVLLHANDLQLSFQQLVSVIAKAQRLSHGLAPDAKMCILLLLDEFQHLGNELSSVMRPVLTTMGDSRGPSRCYDTDGVLLVPLLTGLSLEGARAVEVLGGHPRQSINLEPFLEGDSFAILCELLQKPVFKASAALLDYFAPALDADKPIEALTARQLCFRGLVLDCGGNPSLLVHPVRQLCEHCSGRLIKDSNEFLDDLFASFSRPSSAWNRGTASLMGRIEVLPASLVPIVIASLPISLNRRAVDHKGEPLDETWSQLLSSCGLTPTPHPSFPKQWLIKMPYVFLNSLADRVLPPLHACADFPYLYRSGQAFENLVFKVHAQRTFHLLGKSALAIPGTVFQQLFPGGFVPTTIAECPVRLPDETAMRDGGPQYSSEAGWCHHLRSTRSTVDDIPPSALTGDVYKPSDKNHHHFDGRSALRVQLDVGQPTDTTVLLLWQTKLSQPGSKTTFGLADIRRWHETARTLTERWANSGVKVVFVLILFRKLSAATQPENAKTVYDSVCEYAEKSEDLVLVTMEHMGEYLAGLSHRLYVPLESTSTAST